MLIYRTVCCRSRRLKSEASERQSLDWVLPIFSNLRFVLRFAKISEVEELNLKICSPACGLKRFAGSFVSFQNKQLKLYNMLHN